MRDDYQRGVEAMTKWISETYKKTRATTERFRVIPQKGELPQDGPQFADNVEDGPFRWNFKGLLGGTASDHGHYIAKVWIEGVNRSERVLPIKQAKVISLVTGNSKDMQIRTNKGYVVPDQANPIPPGAKMYLHTLFYDPQAKRPLALGINPKPMATPEPEGITAAQFLQEWGSFRFEIAYTDNLSPTSWGRVFEYAEIKARVDAMNPRSPPTPTVTKRDA
jgi:hypothetical protein